MNEKKFIKSKQIQWAKNQGCSLIGSKGDRGEKAYMKNIDDNIFRGLKSEVEDSFQQGDGGELSGDVAKMQAVHSSAAIAVNVFQYWKGSDKLNELLNSCHLCNRGTEITGDVYFEEKYPVVSNFRTDPNIDVVIKNKADTVYNIYAVESKFSEPYSGWKNDSKGIKEKYFRYDIWEDIPNLKELAISISPADTKFEYLHAAQLIKHILGLKNKCDKKRFRLLYLFYDAPGTVSYQHRSEIDEFAEIAGEDNIKFHSLSYQKLLINLAEKFRENNEAYIKYITERYL